MAGIIEQLANLQSGLAQVQAALGSHKRVPEMRRGTITGMSPDMVLLDGDTAATAVTGSDATLYLGARVRVQVQGRDRWIVSVAPARLPYTPTFFGITIGNAAVSAYYVQDGKVVTLHMEIILGSTTVMGNLFFSLPVPVAMDSSASVLLFDAGHYYYYLGMGILSGGTG